MAKNYLVSIIGSQEVDGKKDNIEVITDGIYETKNGNRYIKYKEYYEDGKDKKSSNVIKIEDENMVTIIHKGENSSRLLLEKGRRHQCHYRTIAGDLLIGVFTDTIKSSLSDKGGDLYVKYTLDFNSDLVSQNEFKINIKEKDEE